jgi:prepilin peptidase CpaA
MEAGGLFGPAPEAAGWLALGLAGPLLLAAMVWDLRRMRIPNGLNGALALLFLPLGLAFLPLEAVAWRYAAGLAVLALGYALFALGKMGGGDVKMLAACAPWVAPAQAPLALQLLALALLAGLALVYPLRRLLRGRTSWRGLRRGARFPMGLSIGAAMLALLALAVPV